MPNPNTSYIIHLKVDNTMISPYTATLEDTLIYSPWCMQCITTKWWEKHHCWFVLMDSMQILDVDCAKIFCFFNFHLNEDFVRQIFDCDKSAWSKLWVQTIKIWAVAVAQWTASDISGPGFESSHRQLLLNEHVSCL